MATLNPQFGSYLQGLKGAEAGMKSYGVHLVGATIKTVALQAASMALNAALTWGVSLAIQGLISLGTYLWKLVPTTEHLKEQLDETAQALADIRSEREGLNDELKTTEERIAELEAKGVLSFTDEAELNRLNKENAALKTKIELLDIEAKKTREQNQKNFNKLIDKKETNTSNTSWTSIDYHGNSEEYRDITDKEKLLELAKIYDEVAESKKDYIDVRGFSHSIEDVEKEITDFSSVAQEYQGYLDDLYQDGFDYNSADEKTKQNIDFANEMIDRYMVLVGKTAIAWERAYSSDRFAEARKSIEELAVSGKLSAESLQDLYNQGGNVKEFIDYMLSLNTVDWKTMLGDDFDRVAKSDVDDGIVSTTEALGWMNEKGENSAKVMGLLANELNKVEEAAEGAESSFKSLTNSLTELGTIHDKFSKLGSALSEFKENGYVSIGTINEIGEAFKGTEGLDDYISKIATASNTSELQGAIKGLVQSYLNQDEVLKDLDGTNKAVLVTQLKRLGVSNAEAVINSKLYQTYSNLIPKLENVKNLTAAEAKNLLVIAQSYNLTNQELNKYNQLLVKRTKIEQLKKRIENNNDGRYDKFITKWLNDIEKLESESQAIANSIDTSSFADKYSGEVDIKINASGLESLVGSGNDKTGSKTIDEAEDQIKAIKHQHEMGLISEAAYYKKLESIRQKYYAGKKDYLDRDRTLQEEYHDWEVSQAEDGFEDKIKSLQEQYANGKITYAKLQSELNKLINETFKNDQDTKNEYLEEVPDYLEEAEEQKDKKNREDFDLSYDKLKYQLENGFISEETYYKKLDELYKKHYGDKTKYLDEYSQYSQEVYDGFKDMYKEDLEADKKALEEKKEAVTEYYDKLIEKIQDAHDEEDYEKEQSEKRKEIFDLDMQIAELMRDGSDKAKARIAELEEERLQAEEDLLDFETNKAREDEIERLENEREVREKEIQDKIDNIDATLDNLDSNTKDIRDSVIQYAKAKGVDIKFAYASGTRSSLGGFGRINEKGIEMISTPDGNGNYIPMLPNSYVFSAKATEFLWKLATEHSLPQAMYNSIAKSIKTQSNTPSVNIAQPITITMGDVIIKGNADKQTVADIKKQQENIVRMVLQKIKELQK